MATKLSPQNSANSERKGARRLKDIEAWDAYCSLPPTHILISSVLCISGVLRYWAPLLSFSVHPSCWVTFSWIQLHSALSEKIDQFSILIILDTAWVTDNAGGSFAKSCRVQKEWSQTRLDLAQISEDCLNPSAKLDPIIKSSFPEGSYRRQAKPGQILLPGLKVEKDWEWWQKMMSERDRDLPLWLL